MFTHSPGMDPQESSLLEKIEFLENDIKSLPPIWACDKTQNSNTKEINRQKHSDSQQNIAVFSAATNLKNINYSYTTQKTTGTKNKIGQNCHCQDRNLP